MMNINIENNEIKQAHTDIYIYIYVWLQMRHDELFEGL